ncbi:MULTISPECIES: alpha/beta fold hydrolase [Bradyrhizobium]|uniref:alpha/beta hydrolase n=1 Tax=Bradyrhizobium TaxID=374 RepID=UPI0009B7A971|nr:MULTISPECIES: alpha/beta fold hydrolase [Bradyrhizobium]
MIMRPLKTMLMMAMLVALPRMTLAADRIETAVAGGDPNISIHLISKKAKSASANSPVLMLHAFGSPCAEAFDLAPGLSWMDDLSEAGFTVYAIDFRGFGQSSRPEAAAPVDRATDAVQDVVAVIEAIRKETGAPKVSLVGWSWGAVVASMVALDRHDLVD